MKSRKKIIVIRKSCVTGKVIWIYRGPSKAAARIAYWRACRLEIERVNHWGETAAVRQANIMRILNDCLADIPITQELTPVQLHAVRQLQMLSKEDIACHREFYEHIIEERRRRKEDSDLRRQMKEREKRINGSYV